MLQAQRWWQRQAGERTPHLKAVPVVVQAGHKDNLVHAVAFEVRMEPGHDIPVRDEPGLVHVFVRHLRTTAALQADEQVGWAGCREEGLL